MQSLLDLLEDKCDFHAYADDVLITKKISNTIERREFKAILKILLDWGLDYDMTWGANKTQRMTLRYKNSRGKTPMKISFDGNKIKPSKTLESLGILFSKECIPYAQIERVKTNVKTMKTLIKKTYRIRTVSIMKKLYTTYILPRISYCCQIWNTGLEMHLTAIEKELESYWRLGDTKVAPKDLLGLQEQLILNDLVLMHRIWKGTSTVDFDEFFSICDHQKKTDAEIRAKSYNKTFAKYTFAHRIYKYWNLLPINTRNLTPGAFKKEVKTILMGNDIKKRRFLNLGLRTAISGPPPSISEQKR